ncbi:protein O-mannosyl-transferase TMTC2 [Anopheles moucheti]|uniref:protein O-mannosyl-transferase TMTC2 n=1 Tax=Anopheles moucheti TaxID=186751 RepID=UPI0022F0BE31|nr:protein O-mannosyl-transferase TMTC2 [Anopheles moucheti]
MDYVSLGCCTLAFVLYINTLSAGFVYDDRRAILGNPDVLGSGSWSQMLQNDFWGTPLVDSGSHGSYRPLCVASFKLNYLVDGFKPFGYHLVNVLLHSLATGLVVKLARHILPVGRSGVAITGLLFAAHPIHTEAVAGVVGRADLTGCIFYLLALLAYIRHVRWRQWGDGRQWLALAGTVLLAGAAILCKETAVTALVVCAIYDIIKGYAGSRDKHRVRSLSIIGLSLAFFLHCRLTLPRPATLFSSADNPTAKSGSLWTRFLTFTYLPVVNFKLLLLPDVLSFDWGMDAIPRIGTVYDRKVALACLFYLALGWAVWSSSRVLARHARQASTASPKSANGAASFNRKLTNKLNLHRLRTEEGTLVPVVPLNVDDPACALCKHDAGLHHSSSCRTLHNNNGMSSIICGCAYAPEYKYLSLAPSTLANYFCRTASSGGKGKGTSSSTSTSSNNNNNDSASINYNQSFQGTVGKKFACHWPLGSAGETSNLSKAKSSEEHTPFPFATLLSTSPEIASTSRTPSLSSSSYTSSSSSSSSSASSSCASSVRGDSADASPDESNHRDGCTLHNSPAAALLMAVALLTLPFLPASNLLFYVGFVVAERILYLPSVGYCLLVGLGVSGLIDGTGVARGHGSSSPTGATGGKPPNYGRCSGRRTGPCWVGSVVRKCVALVSSRTSAGGVYGEGGAGTGVCGGDDATGINRMSVSSDNGRYGKFRTNGSVPTSASVVSGSGPSKPSRPATVGRSGRSSGRSTKAYGLRRRQFVLACVGLLLIAYSAKTVRRNRDWVDEESLFRSAIAVNPPKALGNLGSVLSAQGRYQEAKEALKAALSHRPNMADVHYNLGILLQNQQDYNEAVESFRKAIRFRPSLALAYLNLGTSLIALGRCQEAASVLREGTKLDGSGLRDRVAHENARISALLQLGNLYADQGKLQRALAVYREALHTLPERYPPQGIYHRLGDIFARLNQWSEAERFQRAALEAQPDHIAAHLSYGTMLARNSSRTSEAEQWFRRALRLAPNDASVHHHYAEFLSSQRRTEEAFQYRVKAAELAPEDYALVMAAASNLRLHDRKLEAERWYRQAVKLRPQEARAHTNLGAILHLLGRTQEAANSYREALRLQPDDLTTLSNLAKLGVPAIS